MRTGTSALLLLFAVACASGSGGARVIAFQRAAEGQFGQRHDPALVVAADESARARLAALVGRPVQGDVLVAIFMGDRSTGGYTVRLDSVSVMGSEVRLHGAFVSPGAGAIVTQVITSPFAIAAIARAELPSGRTTYLFVDGERELARAEIVLP